MADARKPRLVSGEIMTAAPAGDIAARREPYFDFVDAEFSTLGNVASTETAASSASRMPKPQAVSAPGMAMLRRQPVQRAPWFSVRGGPFFWTVGLGLAAAAFWFSGGHALVGQAPPFQAVASEQALRIASVSSRVEKSGGGSMLNIDGEAVNESRGAPDAAAEHPDRRQ